MKMVAKKSNPYGGKKRSFGDEVEVRRGDVRLMTALGWFAPAEESKPAPAAAKTAKGAPRLTTRAVVTKEIAPEPESTAAPAAAAQPDADWVGASSDPANAPAEPEAVKPKRTYHRRDLRAEE